MSISIKLDRRALASMIENDPEFKLDLQDNLLNEVATKWFAKDLHKVIEKAAPELFKQAVAALQADEDATAAVVAAIDKQIIVAQKTGWGYSSNRNTLSPEAAKLIGQGVDDSMAAIKTKINELVTAKATEVFEQMTTLKTIDERIQTYVDRIIVTEINNRVDAAVKMKLGAAVAALA